MEQIRWGIVGCGNVTEIKSGPGFQKAEGSSLVAVMRRDHTKAEDYARRHGVPLFVAYYRRALPRFLEVRRVLRGGAIGPVTDVHVRVSEPLAKGDAAAGWRFDPAVAGAGLFYDLASHCLDLLDFLLGPIEEAAGVAVNTGGAYAAEDVTAGGFRFNGGMTGTGMWNFNADRSQDWMVFTGPLGDLRTPVFTDGDVVVRRGRYEDVLSIRNPPHVHQPLIQTIVDELRGRWRCESTGESGARASWVMDRLPDGYRRHPSAGGPR